MIFNDETFDENGNPSGGDGIVYDWWSVKDFSGSKIYGNGHKLTGVYINKPNTQYAGLFGNRNVNLLENFTMSNFYILGKNYVSGLGHNITTIRNCVLGKGAVVGIDPYVSGFSHSASKIMNCKNYATVKGVNGVAGFSGGWSSNLTITDCVNYGNIISSLRYSAGIVAIMSNKTFVKNCVNYGTITGGKDFAVGGIVAGKFQNNINGSIEGCVNYGKIYTSSGSGGIIGCLAGDTIMRDCHNYGPIIGQYTDVSGSLIGQIYQLSGGTCPEVEISDCKSVIDYNASSSVGCVGSIKSKGTIVKMRKIEHTVKNLTEYKHFIYMAGDASLFMSDIKIDIVSKKINSNFLFIRDFAGLNVKIDEVLINSVAPFFLTLKYFNGSTYISSLPETFLATVTMIIAYSDGNGEYLGNDFSGYYYKNRTGQFGLSLMEEGGSFQTKVTEEFLINKNFKKLG